LYERTDQRRRSESNRLSKAKRAFDGDSRSGMVVEEIDGRANHWKVPSFTNPTASYEVSFDAPACAWKCTCQDNTIRHTECKHILLVRLDIDYNRKRRVLFDEDTH
jgi:hypothetical protein